MYLATYQKFPVKDLNMQMLNGNFSLGGLQLKPKLSMFYQIINTTLKNNTRIRLRQIVWKTPKLYEILFF